MADLFINKIGSILVVAPAPTGKLSHMVEMKKVIFYQQIGETVDAITRWIFADLPVATLQDQWGNRYDHQVHSLLAGSLADGQIFLEMLSENGFIVDEEPDMFVPFQRINITSQESSDALRDAHPRAFALARRGKKSIGALVTDIRDSVVLNNS
jgi:hypothetical protein